MADIKKHKAQKSSTEKGWLNWLGLQGFWPIIAITTLLLLLSAWVAWQQQPDPNPYSAAPDWSSGNFWKYPIEHNAFQRLPKINTRLNDVFTDNQKIWAVGDNGIIIHSNNGGQSWAAQSSGTPSSLWSMTFVNPKTGWAVGVNGTIVATTDGGQSWLPQTRGVISTELQDTSFAYNSFSFRIS